MKTFENLCLVTLPNPDIFVPNRESSDMIVACQSNLDRLLRTVSNGVRRRPGHRGPCCHSRPPATPGRGGAPCRGLRPRNHRDRSHARERLLRLSLSPRNGFGKNRPNFSGSHHHAGAVFRSGFTSPPAASVLSFWENRLDGWKALRVTMCNARFSSVKETGRRQ